MLIVYGATAGVSVVKLYAGAFFPGLMLALLYVLYVIIVAKLKPAWMPPLPESERRVPVPDYVSGIAAKAGSRVLPALVAALKGPRNAGVPTATILRELATTLAPAFVFAVLMGLTWHSLTKPDVVTDTSQLEQMGDAGSAESTAAEGTAGVQEPPGSEEEARKEGTGLAEPPAEGEPAAKAVEPKAPAAAPAATPAKPAAPAATVAWQRLPTPNSFWIILGVGSAVLLLFYAVFTFTRLVVFKMLLSSFFPLALLILSVLGTIVFGLATPTEAAAVGSLGGFALAAVYGLLGQPAERRRAILKTWVPLWILVAVSIVWFLLLKFEVLESGPPMWIGWITIVAAAVWCVAATWQVRLGNTVKESVFLTAKTSAMVCWLFVGSSIFSAAFALLGGQDVVERWVLSLGLTPIQFLILAQLIIFLLGWPLEWTEIIVIFMPIFIPLLAKFNIDPLFFGLLVALNLQTAFLSPPVAMAAFYLKGVSPPHVTLNQIFAGMLPFMGIQVIALALLYLWPQIGLWLPSVLYK